MIRIDKNQKTIAGQWAPFNLDGLMTQLVTLKYKCLHSLKHQRKDIKADISDIKGKFDRVDFSYKVERKLKKRKIDEIITR